MIVGLFGDSMTAELNDEMWSDLLCDIDQLVTFSRRLVLNIIKARAMLLVS